MVSDNIRSIFFRDNNLNVFVICPCFGGLIQVSFLIWTRSIELSCHKLALSHHQRWIKTRRYNKNYPIYYTKTLLHE